MPTVPAVAQENRIVGDIGGLQLGCHLSCVEGIAVLVGIPRYDHGCGISRSFANVVIWGVAEQRDKILGIVSCAKLFLPDVRIIEQVIPQHIEHGDHTDDRTKQVRPLSHGGADQ